MNRTTKKCQSAFSLVEVTLAIGLMAFAFIGVFGLIPTGLNTFRQAVDTSVGSQIAQRVINDVQQTDFSSLVSSGTASSQPFLFQWMLSNGKSSTVRYFDDQGNEVIPAGPPSLTLPEQQKILYWVNTRVTPATLVPNSSTYSSLATVTIQVAKNPANQNLVPDSGTFLWTPANVPVSTYSALVARNIDQ